MKMKLLASLSVMLMSGPLLAECNTQMQATAPSSRYVIESNEMVVDTATGLMWKRCAQGFTWSGDTCVENSAEQATFEWHEALALTADYSFGGYSDWRLPNANELTSLAEFQCFNPAINSAVFPNTPPVVFWSNSPNLSNTIFAWGVDFKQGESKTPYRDGTHNVRLVRDY